MKTILSFFLDVIETIVVAMALFVVVYLFFLQPHQVIGNSMVPNFHNKEYILTDKISYRFRKPARGEIVVFKSPEDREKDFIKRMVALPEEKIKIQDGNVFINNKRLSESYLESGRTPAGRFLREGEELSVPQDSYLVLGDNRLNSSDSRSFGFIHSSEIIGRAFLVYWPLHRLSLVETQNIKTSPANRSMKGF